MLPKNSTRDLDVCVKHWIENSRTCETKENESPADTKFCLFNLSAQAVLRSKLKLHHEK